MDKRIIYTQANGQVAVIVPAPKSGLTIEEIALKDVPKGTEYEIVDAAELPERTFRNAWRKNGKAVGIDMSEARDIHRNTLRELRNPLLEKLDVDFMQAIEANDKEAQAVIANEKQALRDVTKHEDVLNAQTPEQLKGLTINQLLGN